MTASIAFIDEKSYFCQDETQSANLNGPLIRNSMPEYFHIGTPVDIFVLSALTAGRVPLERYEPVDLAVQRILKGS